jgi:Peptidase family M28
LTTVYAPCILWITKIPGNLQRVKSINCRRLALLFLISIVVEGECISRTVAQTPASPIGPLSTRTGLLLTDDATVKLIQNSSGDLAHDYDVRLSTWSRIEATEAYDQAAEWLAGTARKNGLQQVKIEHFPSDGAASYLGLSSKRYWKARKAELWLDSPYSVRITSFAELPNSLCRDSTTADVQAGLVDIGSGTNEEDYRVSVQGKIVLTSGDPALVVDRAVYEHGAAGIVSYWTIPEWDRLNRLPGDNVDLVGWRYLPDPASKPHGTFAFMISPRRAQELKQLMQSGTAVRMKAVVDAELTAGNLGVISGVIPGSKYPDQEVLVTAHLDEIGADDNGSGSASLLEMARTLNHLIDTGQMPRPARTIRFIWGPEFVGSYAWLSKHLTEPARRIADLNYDQVGGDLVKEDSVYQIVSTPDSTPSFLNSVMASILDFMNRYNDENYPPVKEFHIISVNGSRHRLQGRLEPFTGGSDQEVYNHVGIPATFVTTWPEKDYHSSKDTPDKVDATQLHRSVFSGLAAMTMLAYADNDQATEFSELAMVYGRRLIAADSGRAADLILSSPRESLPSDRDLANLIVRHAFQREEAAVRSCEVFSQTQSTRQSVEGTARMLAADEAVYVRQLDALTALQAERMGVDAGGQRILSPTEREAAHLIPHRLEDRRLSGWGYVSTKAPANQAAQVAMVRKALHDTAETMRKGGDNDLRIMSLDDAPAFYADGRRSILDIHDAIAAEYMPIPIAVLETYFQLFENVGVMTIAKDNGSAANEP